ncbi:uncharacterized protein LOC142357484 [Convolutriloba macropyga]|uniref:uncharacterized protein LOC142357484 n=1 Tax=Convolutriloba macropyga TaxID=536237 RepID=UPI003F5273C4
MRVGLYLIMLECLCFIGRYEINGDDQVEATNLVSFYDLELAPDCFANVPYQDGHITVWKHSKTERYFIRPLANLNHTSAVCKLNLLTNETELIFNVILMTNEAKSFVASYINGRSLAKVTPHNIETIPMETIRVVWNDPWGDFDFKLSDLWLSNVRLRDNIDFKIILYDSDQCDTLAETMLTSPEFFSVLELEFTVTTQKSSSQTVEVRTEHFQKGKLFSRLKNENKNNGVAYLNSNDTNRLTEETSKNVLAKVVTEGSYIPTGDEISVSKLIEELLTQSEESSRGFSESKWDSVFWNEEWLRPDKLTSTLNENYSKEFKMKSQHHKEQNSVSREVDFDLEISVEDQDVEGSAGGEEGGENSMNQNGTKVGVGITHTRNKIFRE